MILETHRTGLERLVTELEANETLDRQQIETCLGVAERESTATGAQPISA